MNDEQKANLDKIAKTQVPMSQQLRRDVPDAAFDEVQAARNSIKGNNGGPPDLNRIGELSARGIDKISIEVADQIREIGEAAVTHAEAIRAEAGALADSILEQGRRFSDRVASFTTTAESMMNTMNEQRARLHKTIV